MQGGTEAFPDLGKHCQYVSCNLLDFLPFTCHGCQKVFCLEHRSYKSHDCPKEDFHSRMVIVCDLCSMSIEKEEGENESILLAKHSRSGNCNQSKKNKPKCPVNRCKQILTFSNTNVCKRCYQKVCLKHRFPSDHDCSSEIGSKFLTSLEIRNGKGCGRAEALSSSSAVLSGLPEVH